MDDDNNSVVIVGVVSVNNDNADDNDDDNNNDNDKELNQVMSLFSHCSTNAPTSASKVHYNSSSHSKPQQEQYK